MRDSGIYFSEPFHFTALSGGNDKFSTVSCDIIIILIYFTVLALALLYSLSYSLLFAGLEFGVDVRCSLQVWCIIYTISSGYFLFFFFLLSCASLTNATITGYHSRYVRTELVIFSLFVAAAPHTHTQTLIRFNSMYNVEGFNSASRWLMANGKRHTVLTHDTLKSYLNISYEK